jgi:adenine deaminase
MAIYCETALRLRLIATAQELAAPDLLVRGGRVWNAYTGEILTADIAICGDRIAKVGKWAGPLGDATEVVEADISQCPGISNRIPTHGHSATRSVWGR